jgi:hypothetical protein
MSAKDRLQTLQTALETRGAKDVKFFFSSYAQGEAFSVVADHAGNVLQAILASDGDRARPLGDSHIK